MGKPRRPAPKPAAAAAAKRKAGAGKAAAGGGKKPHGGGGAKNAKSKQQQQQQQEAKGKGSKAKAAPVSKRPVAAAAAAEEEEEYEVGEDDLAFFEEHAGFAAGFLESNPLGEGGQQAKAKRKQPEEQAEEGGKKPKKTAAAAAPEPEHPQQEQQEEGEGGEPPACPAAASAANGSAKAPVRGRKPSTQGWEVAGANVQVKERLPVKTIDGRLQLRTEEVPVAEEEDEEEEPEAEAQEPEAAQGGKGEAENESDEEKDEYDVDVGSDSDVSASEVLSRGRMSLAPQARAGAGGVAREEMAGKYTAAAEGLTLRAFGGDARALRRARLELKKVEIATLCEAVLEDPEAGFMKKVAAAAATSTEEKGKKGQGKTRMATLLTLMEDDDVRVQGLATLSLLAVFRDVAPSYRIRLPTEKELAVKVSKEVQRMRDYERGLLGAYQAYLKHLEATCRRARLIAPPGGFAGGWKNKGKKKGGKQGQERGDPAALLAARCLCELLAALPHFNFTTNVLAAVVRLGLGPDAGVRAEAARAVRRLLERDSQGDVSLTAAKLVAKEVVGRRLQAPDDVVRALQALKLRVTEDEAEALLAARRRKGGKGGRGGGPRRGEEGEEGEGEGEEGEGGGIRADILAGLKEAEARADPELRARCQAEALQEVTVLYFRVLKHRPEKAVPPHLSLLPAALEGLSKVAHLINLDTVVDLMDVLKELLEPERRLPLQASLHAVLTALRTLQGPGRELKVDDKAFVAFLYQQLRRVRADMVVAAAAPAAAGAPGATPTTKQPQQALSPSPVEGVLPLLATCLRAALVERREYSLARVAAFYKQLAALALHLPGPKEARVPLALAQELAGRYPGLDQLLDSEADRVAMGVYKPDAPEPEMSNPLATGAWELALLRCHHHHPRVRQAAAAVVAATRGGGSGGGKAGGGVRDPLASLREPEDLAQRGFGGVFTRLPRANPLHGMVRRAEREKKGRREKVKLFFVQKVARPELSAAEAAVGGGRLLQGVVAGADADVGAGLAGDGDGVSFKPFYREARTHLRKMELCQELAGLRGALAAYRKQQRQQQTAKRGKK